MVFRGRPGYFDGRPGIGGGPTEGRPLRPAGIGRPHVPGIRPFAEAPGAARPHLHRVRGVALQAADSDRRSGDTGLLIYPRIVGDGTKLYSAVGYKLVPHCLVPHVVAGYGGAAGVLRRNPTYIGSNVVGLRPDHLRRVGPVGGRFGESATVSAVGPWAGQDVHTSSPDLHLIFNAGVQSADGGGQLLAEGGGGSQRPVVARLPVLHEVAGDGAAVGGGRPGHFDRVDGRGLHRRSVGPAERLGVNIAQMDVHLCTKVSAVIRFAGCVFAVADIHGDLVSLLGLVVQHSAVGNGDLAVGVDLESVGVGSR